MSVGVLSLQGDFAEHLAILGSLGISAIEVRDPCALAETEYLIIPGGESTVIGKLLKSSGLWDPITERAKDETLAIYGTCAGAILLAQEVTGKNPPDTLGLLDITVDRNAYGSQINSFAEDLPIEAIGSLSVSFIRAPKITRVGDGIEVLAVHQGDPVLVREGRILAGTFHPEVEGESSVHEMFLRM